MRWPTSLTYMVTSEVKGQGYNVTSSFWCLFAYNSTKKSHRTDAVKLVTEKLSMAWVALRSSSNARRSQVMVTRQMLRSKVSHVFGTWRCTNFKRGVWMEHKYLHWCARWPPGWKLWWLFSSPHAGGGGTCGGHTTDGTVYLSDQCLISLKLVFITL